MTVSVLTSYDRDIKPGTLLISEKPFAYVLSSKYRTKNCDYCFASGELRKCSNCQYVYYCNKVCQKDGWSVHKMECAKLKKISPKILPDAARLLARLIKKLDKGGDLVQSFYAPNRFRKFKDLMSHYSDIKEDSRKMEHFTTLYAVLSEYLDGAVPNSSELKGIYGRMCINSFDISDEELKSLGTGIYLAASIFDHSCEPNAVAVFQGVVLNVRTTVALPDLKWEKISLSYIDTLQGTEWRQQELKSTYYFLCKCPRCVNIEENKLMAAAVCPNVVCKAAVNVRNKAETGTPYKCHDCDKEISESFIQTYNDVTEFTRIHLENMKLALLDLDVCKICLSKHKGVLHDLNIQHVRILDSAFEASIDFGRWNDAKKYGLRLLPSFRKYLGEVHPLVGLLYLKLAKILIYQESIEEAESYLQNAYKILKITHSERSVLFKNELLPLIRNNYSAHQFFNS